MTLFDTLANLLVRPPHAVRTTLEELGLLSYRTCRRCGGTGEHLYNALDGRMCYGCKGTGRQSLVTTATVAKVKALRNLHRCGNCGGIDEHADGCCDGKQCDWVATELRARAMNLV